MMKDLIEEHSSTLTLENLFSSRNPDSTRNICPNIPLGKPDSCIEAIRAGLKILEEGGTVDEAKVVCSPDILSQLIRWDKKLQVCLAPFLHGMCYTSFSRCFLTVNKLQEIVNKLQCYVQSGDTIVDFCCGDNNFSRLMKTNLDASGKKCSFKNYDLIHPKHDSGFERKDWMKIEPKELPTGSKLIVGLNPPFGINGTLADKYIDKALTFKPKLLVLIVPNETRRLDEKQSRYDLIWEDCKILSEKSLLSPVFGDANDMQIEEQSLEPPTLYLWSRPDWTKSHEGIALKRGHVSTMQREEPAEEEGDTMTIAAEHRKREPLENSYGKGSEKLKTKTKEQGEGKKSSVMDSSLRVKKSSDKDLRIAQSAPCSFQGDSNSRPRNDIDIFPDSFGFARTPLHPSLRNQSCGWLDD